jgi:hypothetical protein
MLVIIAEVMIPCIVCLFKLGNSLIHVFDKVLVESAMKKTAAKNKSPINETLRLKCTEHDFFFKAQTEQSSLTV